MLTAYVGAGLTVAYQKGKRDESSQNFVIINILVLVGQFKVGFRNIHAPLNKIKIRIAPIVTVTLGIAVVTSLPH